MINYMIKTMIEQKSVRRYHSQPKRSNSKECSKRQKVLLLKHKFKKALQNINQLKHQNSEDYNHLKQLMLSSQRIEKIAHQSREKTKLLIGDSLEAKRRNTMPSTLQSRRTTPFQLTDQTQKQKINTLETHFTENQQSLPPNQSDSKDRRNYKQQESVQKFIVTDGQKIQQLSNQNENSEIRVRIEEFSLRKSQHTNIAQKQNSSLKNSICFRSTRLRESTVSPCKKKVMKQGIKPYIMALIFSIFLLLLLKL